MMWAIDLDGVVWLSDAPIDGAAAAVGRLQQAGEQVVFVTNNSSVRLVDLEAKLGRQGIEAAGAVVSSASVVAAMVSPGERALCCGGPGLVEELTARDVEVVVNDGSAVGPVDVVVVGFHRDFDFARMDVASSAVRAGARLLASNDDATYPTPAGPIPGGGAILAGIERACGVQAVVAGKPYPPMVEHLRERWARVDPHGGRGIVVGDRADTDGRLAHGLGWRFGLVLSGVDSDAGLLDPPPDEVAPTLASLVERMVP